MNPMQTFTEKRVHFSSPMLPSKLEGQGVVARQVEGLRAVLKRLEAAQSISLDGVTREKISRLTK